MIISVNIKNHMIVSVNIKIVFFFLLKYLPKQGSPRNYKEDESWPFRSKSTSYIPWLNQTFQKLFPEKKKRMTVIFKCAGLSCWWECTGYWWLTELSITTLLFYSSWHVLEEIEWRRFLCSLPLNLTSCLYWHSNCWDGDSNLNCPERKNLFFHNTKAMDCDTGVQCLPTGHWVLLTYLLGP